MNTELITLNSRINIKKGVITEKKLKTDTEEGFTRSIAFVTLLAILAFCFYRIFFDKDYFYIIQLFLVLIWLAPHIKRIYASLFIKTWKSVIRIADIESVASLKMQNGLETQVTMHLKNGRKKFLIFRDAENQVEDFIHSIETKEIVQQAPQV